MSETNAETFKKLSGKLSLSASLHLHVSTLKSTKQEIINRGAKKNLAKPNSGKIF